MRWVCIRSGGLARSKCVLVCFVCKKRNEKKRELCVCAYACACVFCFCLASILFAYSVGCHCPLSLSSPPFTLVSRRFAQKRQRRCCALPDDGEDRPTKAPKWAVADYPRERGKWDSSRHWPGPPWFVCTKKSVKKRDKHSHKQGEGQESNSYTLIQPWAFVFFFVCSGLVSSFSPFYRRRETEEVHRLMLGKEGVLVIFWRLCFCYDANSQQTIKEQLRSRIRQREGKNLRIKGRMGKGEDGWTMEGNEMTGWVAKSSGNERTKRSPFGRACCLFDHKLCGSGW